MATKIDIGGHSWIGHRDSQEDCYMAYNMVEKLPTRATRFVVNKERSVSMGVLCDGMGGEGKGAMCSCLAVQQFAEAFAETGSFRTQWIERMKMALYSANAAITDFKIASDNVGTRSGCVLVAAVISDERLHYISVGDASIWLFRPEMTPGGVYYKQHKINKAHTIYTKRVTDAQGNVTKTVISPEEAEECRRNAEPGVRIKGQPYSALIGGDISYIDHSPLPSAQDALGGIKLQTGDVVVLASDGVEKALDSIAFETLMRDFGSEDYKAAQTAHELILAVENQGNPHSDNSSCIVFKITTK